jgi:hypothetical protein
VGMAGYRRTNAERAAASTGMAAAVVRRPTQAEQRRQRRVEALTGRLKAARTPGDRVSVAAGYLRGALKHADPTVAERVAKQVVEQLIRHGHELLAE